MERDPEGHRPTAFEAVAVEVDDQEVVGPELLPQQEPGVAEQGAVGLPVGDVAGQVVVVPLVPQRPGQQDQLLARGQVGEEGPGCGTKSGTQGRRSAGRGHRYRAAAFSWVSLRSSSTGRWPQQPSMTAWVSGQVESPWG